MTDGLAIGVDLGATKIAAALVTFAGEVVASVTLPTQKEYEVTVGRIAQQINAFVRQAEGDLLGIGIGLPGLVRPAEGVLVYSMNLGWSHVNVIDDVTAELESAPPIWIQTDTNTCILGEYFFGAARGYDDILFTSIGSGLGGALICNGRLVTGVNNTAGFIGLYSLDPAGRPDTSGLRGNTEALVSGRGLVTIVRELLAEAKHPTQLEDSENLSPEKILKAARDGDALACTAFADMGRCLGTIWAPAVAMLNPARIVLGGGIGLAAFDLIAPVAREALETRLTPVSYVGMEIVPSGLKSSAVGAACLAFAKAGTELPQLD